MSRESCLSFFLSVILQDDYLTLGLELKMETPN